MHNASRVGAFPEWPEVAQGQWLTQRAWLCVFVRYRASDHHRDNLRLRGSWRLSDRIASLIQTGWRFPGAGDSDENQIGLIVVANSSAIIIIERKIDGIDTSCVLSIGSDRMTHANRIA